jgi:predicted small lipoprotein YifL
MRGKKLAARVCVSFLAACALLTACGQRGALFLPDEGRNVVVSPAQSPAEAAPAAAPAATPAASPAEPAATTETEEQRRSNATAPTK